MPPKARTIEFRLFGPNAPQALPWGDWGIGAGIELGAEYELDPGVGWPDMRPGEPGGCSAWPCTGNAWMPGAAWVVGMAWRFMAFGLYPGGGDISI